MSALDVLRRLTGQTVPAAPAAPAAPKPSALNGGSDRTPYDAASRTSQDMGEWFPWLGSPDLEINPWRDRIVARVRDLVRNDGWASGAVSSILDAAIGGDLRLIAKPDWRQLRIHAPGFDAVWADEFAQAAQALWRGYSNDLGRWCDGARRLTMTQMFRLAFRHKLIDGEALAALLWLPDRRAPGRAHYATTLQIIDPDRLSNPNLLFDMRFVRGGVEIDQLGAAQAYYIRRAHQGDWFNAPEALIWDRIPRETEEGRPVVIHDFDAERAGQHRAAGGIFTPVLARMKMLTKYDQVELQAAVINAIFAAYIESPYDQQDVQSALEAEVGGRDPRMAELSMYQQLRTWWHGERPLSLNGARIPTLMSGEKINTIAATRPSSQYEAFQGALLRNVSAATGQSHEQVSHDWSKTNYSSARGAILEAWKTLHRRRADFGNGFATPVYAGWLEEAMDRGELPLPRGAPEFHEARAAYAACVWMGPGRGWVDPVKEAEAAVLRMDAGITTLIQECAEQGHDWEEQVADRAIIVKRFKDAGLTLPAWAHDVPASQIDVKPQAA